LLLLQMLLLVVALQVHDLQRYGSFIQHNKIGNYEQIYYFSNHFITLSNVECAKSGRMDGDNFSYGIL
jgi:hypothetical protein